ncbi:patatin-like phospholipase family protein [Flagellimonas sp. S3867]|uniref:patatin-like phospholipase family protein n=1 Tax=Flagellimonas sp. S3867 TaxID=2768063 RepID=UPI001684C944|nr:patatin-like phospholipase family protein [Flagellimonas sp. S3867]
MKTKNIGLVLSGGGHRGVAHAGGIKALEEFGIYPNIISGASAGALVGALYAANYSPEAIKEIFKKIKLFNISRLARKKAGFINVETFYDFLLDYFKTDNFEALSKKMYVTATDLVNAKVNVFDKDNLIYPILASASFPGILTPVSIKGTLYSDGGILDNFPVDPIIDQCDVIYGIYASPIRKMAAEEFKHSYNVLDRAFHLRIHQHSITKFKLCDLVIYPKDLSKYGLFNTDHIDEVFEIGYQETIKELKKKFGTREYSKNEYASPQLP